MEHLYVASWEALSYICAIYVVVQHSSLGVDGGVFFDLVSLYIFMCDCEKEMYSSQIGHDFITHY